MHLFLKRCRGRGRGVLVALRKARNLPIGVFFLIAFSFAPACAKEKADGHKSFVLTVCFTLNSHGRGEYCSPAKKRKETFLFSYFCMTKSTNSHQRERSPLFENSSRVHELVARAMRGECVRQGAKRKSIVLPLSAISYYHACEHITRGSRADSCTHCLHAR